MKRNKMDFLAQFIAEAGMLKNMPRSGWNVLGIKNPESVADHCFRCAVIGYILAGMERADKFKVLLMTLFNDIHEARITDLHKMAQRYIDLPEIENKAFFEQIEFLPENIRSELAGLRKEYLEQKTGESLIARDADIIECLIQAKEYINYGYPQAEKFLKKSAKLLRTKTALSLWAHIKSDESMLWWEKLPNIKR
ncbi:MAG: HD domain-containing protein [Candidatus Omnitrophica bacterium]|jgi:putative hydrolase of HD superfamily|nr:HD domain-containing protein [Candidatus Omnitrophota bacterium]MDD5081448.1 HD domain-containing protein [Candidatus Omnitrophota bacterium]MDD5440813.1 HD domain-containing protein [Candidatus Omnitrophota bacterium]